MDSLFEGLQEFLTLKKIISLEIGLKYISSLCTMQKSSCPETTGGDSWRHDVMMSATFTKHTQSHGGNPSWRIGSNAQYITSNIYKCDLQHGPPMFDIIDW